MTVTKRKANSRTDEPRANTSKSGIQYTCDACSADISHTVRLRCAQVNPASSPGGQPSLVCDNFDLCGRCFCEGREVGRHKKWHDYRVVEQHAFPIFTEEWGADEELLLIDACQTYGLGNWGDIADRVGSGRTKEEVAQHYIDTYLYSEDYPLPPADAQIDIDQEEFQSRKRRRIEAVQARPLQPPAPKPLASGPSNHEIGGFMPGRLDFETEWENDAETSIKDLTFGRVYRFGGASQPEKDASLDDGRRDDGGGAAPAPVAAMPASSRGMGLGSGAGKVTKRKDDKDKKDKKDQIKDENGDEDEDEEEGDAKGDDDDEDDDDDDAPLSRLNGVNGVESNDTPAAEDGRKKSPDKDDEDEEGPVMDEDDEDLELKLAVMEIYNDRYDRRVAAKALVFDRNLLEYRKAQANERKMPKEQRDLVTRVKPFARLQTAFDHEKFQDGLLYEATLRKRISELQEYRRMGITSLAEAERYEKEKSARQVAKQREYLGFDRLAARKRGFDDFGSREGTPSGKAYRRPLPVPLTLSTAESLQLLDPSEVLLCSRIQVLPKPFLFIKELFFRELARRGGYLPRDVALRLVPLSAETVGEDGQSRLEAIYDFYLGEGGGADDAESTVADEDEDDEDDEGASSDDNAEAEAAEVEASLQGPASASKNQMAPDSPESEARLEEAVAGLMEAAGQIEGEGEAEDEMAPIIVSVLE